MIGGIWRLIKDLFLMRKFELHLPDKYTRAEKINLGEQWIRVLDYKKCGCWTKYGPSNTCERCKGCGKTVREFVNACRYVLFNECDGRYWSIRVEYLDTSENVVGWSGPLFSSDSLSTLRRMVEMALSVIPHTDSDSCPGMAPLTGFEPEGGD